MVAMIHVRTVFARSRGAEWTRSTFGTVRAKSVSRLAELFYERV